MSSNTQEPTRVVAFDEPDGSHEMPDDWAMPRDLRVALLEDILSLREHRIANLQRRIQSLEDELAAKDERLEAHEQERRQMIENYERILAERDGDASSTSDDGPVGTLQDLLDTTVGH